MTVTAPGNSLIIIAITLGVVLSSAYAIGRIHEWYRHGVERDEAYRSGYDRASFSLMGMTVPAPPPRTPRQPRSSRLETPTRVDHDLRSWARADTRPWTDTDLHSWTRTDESRFDRRRRLLTRGSHRP